MIVYTHICTHIYIYIYIYMTRSILSQGWRRCSGPDARCGYNLGEAGDNVGQPARQPASQPDSQPAASQQPASAVALAFLQTRVALCLRIWLLQRPYYYNTK